MGRFLHIGNGAYVNVDLVDYIAPADAAKVKKIIKKYGVDTASLDYIEACETPEIRSLIVMTDGKLVVSMLTSNTLNKRLNNNLEE